MRKVIYLTKPLLRQAAGLAEEINANRQIEFGESFDDLPDDLKFPVSFHMLHERGQSVEIRFAFLFPLQLPVEHLSHLTTFWLDVPIEFFNDLPTVEVPERGLVPPNVEVPDA